MDTHDCFARNEEALREKLINRAILDYESKSKKKEDKRMQRLEAKASSAPEANQAFDDITSNVDGVTMRRRGPTLREAYENLKLTVTTDQRMNTISSVVSSRATAVDMQLRLNDDDGDSKLSYDSPADGPEDGEVDDAEPNEVSEEELANIMEKKRQESDAMKRDLQSKRKNTKYKVILSLTD
jgi:hypothetical protein